MDTEITLEKIELVKDRTGVSYKEAKDALEAAKGSVVDAIINIEETVNMSGRSRLNDRGVKLIEAIKAAVKKGNVTKIIVKKDGEIILNLPVNVGILGTVIAPWAALIGVIAAFGTKCDIELLTDDGRVIDIGEKAGDAFDDAVERGADIIEDVRMKGADVIDSVRAKAKKAVSKETDAAAEDYACGSARDAKEDAPGGFDDYVSTEADKDDAREAEGETPISRIAETVERTAKTVSDVVSEAADRAAEVLRNAVNATKNTEEEEEKPGTDA
ncbi:MAG: DUF4342 domain-containing protein [Clostridiales Family XIII bacterium]|jgi:hypothetical protein|nr:DUF4342 domain-containing protein [Clostridiales Family XIII bacterium]